MAVMVAQRVEGGNVRRPRTIDERVFVRFPRVYTTFGLVISRLSPHSRLRQALVRRQAESGWAASSRGDFELMGIRYGDQVVLEWTRELVTLGLPPRVEGYAAWLGSVEEFRSVWAEWSYRLAFIIDLGDGLVTLGEGRLRGAASGIDTEIGFCQVIEHRNGIVTRERDFTEWPEALAAAGFDPAVQGRLDRLTPGAVVEL